LFRISISTHFWQHSEPMEFISGLETIPAYLHKVFESKRLLRNNDSLIVYDLDFLKERIQKMQYCFPEDALHALAVKASPLVNLLRSQHTQGIGLEAASLPEVYLALKAGYKAQDIVFDSPCKTIDDLEFALTAGVRINADSFAELERIDQLYKELGSKSIIGLRINPQLGEGSIPATSVAGRISKFGVPADEQRGKILEVYNTYKWLRGIHLHIGSQGMSQQQLVSAVEKVYNLAGIARVIREAKGWRLDVFDMGGGFPVSYKRDQLAPDIKDYADALEVNCPGLFDGSYKLITEFGRYVFANTASAISKVEYVKEQLDSKIAIIHLGADFLLRKAYNPTNWHHDISVIDKQGRLKMGTDKKPYMVAGPLCFGGDIIEESIQLPVIEAGDYLVIHDVGAYTLSMWSRYNSRQMPEVLGVSKKEISVLKKRETLFDILKFWT
jgi:diaminopimelate decarboxylase